MFKIESQFIHKTFPCVVIMTDGSYRCGYVAIPKKHKLYGVTYNTNKMILRKWMDKKPNEKIGKRGIIPVVCHSGKGLSPEVAFDVHGSITFSEKTKDYPVKLNAPGWWYGFDCAHAGDGKDLSKISPNKRKYYTNFEGDIIRSKSYVIKECKRLAEQLSDPMFITVT